MKRITTRTGKILFDRTETYLTRYVTDLDYMRTPILAAIEADSTELPEEIADLLTLTMTGPSTFDLTWISSPGEDL